MAIQNSDILNAIRVTSTDAYQDAIPFTTMDVMTDVGVKVLNAPPRVKEEFYDALINKVGLQLFNDQDFANPLMALKKGRLEYGDTIEDIFVSMANSADYITGTRPGETPPDPYAVNKLDCDSAYYTERFERQYTVTMHEEDLKTAFFNANGLGRLVSTTMMALKNGEVYDDYRNTLSLIARQVEQSLADGRWRGDVHLLTEYNEIYTPIADPNEALATQSFLQFMSNRIRKWSDRLTSPDLRLNNANVINWVSKDRQKLMILTDIISDLDTNLLAWAFNQGRLSIGEFMEVDNWYSKGVLPGIPPNDSFPYDITAKGKISEDSDSPLVALLCDQNMFKIYNRLNSTTNIYNPKGHYWNTFRTVDDYFAASPFLNFVAFFLD